MKVQALFCDYDGTLAPLNVARSRSRVPVRLAETLWRIHESIPVAIVTAKDYSFIRERTSFADAWSCVYGFETVTRDGARRVGKPHLDFFGVVRVVKRMLIRPLIEPKKTSSGDVCGLCVEWSSKDAPDEEIMNASLSKIRKSGLAVLYDSLYPMLDIIPRGHNKGMAVGVMKEMLGVKEGLMFVGDSPGDNPAFAVAEVGIGVVGAQPRRDLDCDYLVDRRMLNHFLSALLKNSLEFSEDLPGIRANRS